MIGCGQVGVRSFADRSVWHAKHAMRRRCVHLRVRDVTLGSAVRRVAESLYLVHAVLLPHSPLPRYPVLTVRTCQKPRGSFGA